MEDKTGKLGGGQAMEEHGFSSIGTREKLG
jgi:hypothetical protein